METLAESCRAGSDRWREGPGFVSKMGWLDDSGWPTWDAILVGFGGGVWACARYFSMLLDTVGLKWTQGGSLSLSPSLSHSSDGIKVDWMRRELYAVCDDVSGYSLSYNAGVV